MELFELPRGSRIAIAGKTGSGKSTLARRYLAQSGYHWLIFNPKASKVFDPLRPKKLNTITESAVYKSLEKEPFTSLQFPPRWDHKAQDELLLRVQERFEGFGVCIDELYHIHNQGIAGPGLTGLLTRGRELRQSFLGLTQRPMFVAKFVFSEADAIIEFELRYEDDLKRMREYTGSQHALLRQRDHDFLFFPLDSDRVIRYRQK